jgi:hypothetical protein
MTRKTRIVADLGEPGLRLPTLLNDGLVVNDRAERFFSLLRPALARG